MDTVPIIDFLQAASAPAVAEKLKKIPFTEENVRRVAQEYLNIRDDGVRRELVLLIFGTACSQTFDSDDCMERMMRNVVSAFCPERGGPLRYEVQEDWIGDGGKSSIKFFNRVHQYLADKGDGKTFLLAKDFLSLLSDAIREETMNDPVREAYESLCTLIQTMENERMCAVKELLPTDGIL
jgi:hypothetical protein